MLLPPQRFTQEKKAMAGVNNFNAGLLKAQKWSAVCDQLSNGAVFNNVNRLAVQNACAVGSGIAHKAELEGVVYGL